MINRNDFTRYINHNRPLVNVDGRLRIERATGGLVWRAVMVYHLTPEENQGKHLVFVDALSQSAQWILPQRSIQVGWTWEGRRDDEPAPPRDFEKLPPEPAAQVDLGSGKQVTSIWLNDRNGTPSDKVHGLRSDYENTAQWNTWGHNSFIVFFQLMQAAVVQPPVEPPVEPPTGSDTIELNLTKPTVINIRGNQVFQINVLE